jgi:hypothetical protein
MCLMCLEAIIFCVIRTTYFKAIHCHVACYPSVMFIISPSSCHLFNKFKFFIFFVKKEEEKKFKFSPLLCYLFDVFRISFAVSSFKHVHILSSIVSSFGDIQSLSIVVPSFRCSNTLPHHVISFGFHYALWSFTIPKVFSISHPPPLQQQ